MTVAGLTISGVQVGNYTLIQPTTIANITPATVGVMGITANNKVYDHTTTATLNLGSAVVQGVFPGDTVTLSATGGFAFSGVGTNLTVHLATLTLGGAQAGDYTTFLNQTSPKASITPAPLTVTGITANNKLYDGTTAATLNTGSAALVGVFSGDTVSLVKTAATGTFVNKNAGNNVTVNVSGLTLSGGQASDYVLTQPTTSANITAHALTFTAITNTKTYDATAAALALPTVSGLVSGDTATGLAEVYSDANVGSSKTLSVSSYTVNDGNSGNNYIVIKVTNTKGVIVANTFSKFVDTVPSGNTVVAGSYFLFTVQAADPNSNPVSSYNGPINVSTTVSPADPLGNFPVAGNLQVSTIGLGYFLGTLQTAGTYILTTSAGGFTGTSGPITVVPTSANYFTVAAATTATTGGFILVTVTARDPYGNIVTGYTGTVKLSSTDGGASLGTPYTFTTGAGQDNGVHTFNVTLNTGGNQFITAADTASSKPTVAGTSSAITTRGLVVTSLTPTPTGFTATFSKAFMPADLALYAGDLKTVADVVLTGNNGVGPIHGSLIIDPSNQSLTFKATASYLTLLNSIHGGHDSDVLPDATYTVKLISGSGSNGFLDTLGVGLDGANNGGNANYTNTFTTHYQANGTPVLSIPDFARGPDSNTPIRVPNESAFGIPITLYNAAGVTDVTFSLTYNAALLNVTGTLSGLNSDATDAAATLSLVSNIGGVATFHYSDSNPQSAMPLVLGDLAAVVPSGSGAAALGQYQVKELLQLGNITINQGAVTGAVGANGVHVNAYFGDVNADKVIDGLDKLTANNVATGGATGFSRSCQAIGPGHHRRCRGG